jgi:putative transposase
MSFARQPWQLLVMILAGWVNRRQQAVIEDLRAENQVLKGKLGKQRILLDDDQRRRLGVKGKVLGRKILGERSVRPCESTMSSFAAVSLGLAI